MKRVKKLEYLYTLDEQLWFHCGKILDPDTNTPNPNIMNFISRCLNKISDKLIMCYNDSEICVYDLNDKNLACIYASILEEEFSLDDEVEYDIAHIVKFIREILIGLKFNIDDKTKKILNDCFNEYLETDGIELKMWFTVREEIENLKRQYPELKEYKYNKEEDEDE